MIAASPIETMSKRSAGVQGRVCFICREWQALSRKRSRIRPLLAARARPAPCAPSLCPDAEKSDATTNQAVPIASAIAQLKSAADAMQRADEGLGDVLSLLQDLHAVFDDRDEAYGCLPISVLRAREARTEGIVASIDRLVGRMRFGGLKLFGGRFAIDLSGITSGKRPVVRFPTLETDGLGDSRVGSLRSLVSTFSETPTADSIAAARSIITGARRHIEGHRRQLLAFMDEHVLPELNARTIALENVLSARAVDMDMAFAERASRVTPIDALLQQSQPEGPSNSTAAQCGLTLTEE